MQRHYRIILRAFIRFQGAPVFNGLLPFLALWGELTTFQVVESSVIRCYQARFRAHLNRHVAQGHTTFHAQRLNGRAAEFNHITSTACAAGFTDDRQHDIFGGNAGGRLAQYFNLHGFRPTLFQGLSGKYMFHFRGADTKRQRAERAVGGGVRVAAHNGHARQRHTLLRTDNVDDALEWVIQVIQLYAKFFAVLHQLLHLNTRHLARRIDIFGLGRDVVIHRGKGFARLTDFTSVCAQAIKGLWRGHFMDQVTIDVE